MIFSWKVQIFRQLTSWHDTVACSKIISSARKTGRKANAKKVRSIACRNILLNEKDLLMWSKLEFRPPTVVILSEVCVCQRGSVILLLVPRNWAFVNLCPPYWWFCNQCFHLVSPLLGQISERSPASQTQWRSPWWSPNRAHSKSGTLACVRHGLCASLQNFLRRRYPCEAGNYFPLKCCTSYMSQNGKSVRLHEQKLADDLPAKRDD